MYSIGDLCKMFNLSRSTILYYDKMNLLKSSRNEENNYRIYDEEQVKRLEKIMGYRESGVSLKDIQDILDMKSNKVTNILLRRIEEIQKEIRALKKQEQMVVDVLKEEVLKDKTTHFTAASWSELLINLGYDDRAMLDWHKEFERKNSKLHREFLKNLKMDKKDVDKLVKELKNS